MDFTTRNIAIAKLLKADVPEDADIIQVPNKIMSPLMKAEASILYEAIFQAPFEGEDFSLSLKCKNGEVQRIYGPSAGAVMDDDGETPISAIGIKWGEKVAVIPLKGSSLVAPSIDEEKSKELGMKFAKFEVDEANFGFQNNEISVNIALETDEDYFTVSFPLRFQDPKNAPDLSAFKTGLKKDATKFLTLLYGVFEGRGGGEGGGIRKLTELNENESVTIVDVIEYEFTTKKGEDRVSQLLVSDAGDKFWSADVTAPAIKYLLSTKANAVIVTILEKAKGKKNEYIVLGQLETDDGELIIPFGSQIPTVKEKELREGVYTVLNVDSFTCSKEGKNFLSYVYTVFDEDHEIYKTFVPSKHRTVLQASPRISVEEPGSFTVFESGLDNGNFTVSQLKCADEASDYDFDVSAMF